MLTTPRRHVLAAAAALTLAAGANAQNSLFAPCAQWKTFEEAGLGETLRGPASIGSLVTFDLDGPGPDGETVLASTSAAFVNGQPATPVIRWNGLTWLPVATPTDFAGETRLWVVESPDGTGKALYATSRALTTATTPVLYKWTGAEFTTIASLGTQTGTRITSLVTFDPDGPAAREVYFIENSRLLRLRSGAIEVVTDGVGTYQLLEFAPSGGQRRLVLTGVTSTAATSPVIRGIAAYDGVNWSTLGNSLFGLTSTRTPTVTSAVIADPDGAGPLGETLVIGGLFRVGSQTGPAGLAYLQGDQWVPFGAGLTLDVDSSSSVQIVSIAQNNLSTTLPRLVIEGDFSTVDNVNLSDTAMLVGQTWQAFPALDYNFSWFSPPPTAADFDGPGGNPPEIVFGNGRRTNDAAAEPIPAIAFDGTNARPLASQLISSSAARIFELRVLPDESGVLRLHAAGNFGYAGNRFIGSVAKLVNGSWQPIGTPRGGSTASTVRHDFDGPGPAPAQYVALGQTAATLLPASQLFTLNGSSWSPLNATMPSGTPFRYTTLESWDPDEDGPGAPVLLASLAGYAGGASNSRPAALVQGVWQPLGVLPTGTNSYSKFVFWDADGAGPGLRRPYINFAGLQRFDATDTNPASWGSVPWTRLSPPVFGSGLTIDRASPSGAPSLLFDGSLSSFSSSSGGIIVRRFSENTVTEISLSYAVPGIGPEVSIGTWDYDGDGPQPARTVATQVQSANIPPFSNGFGEAGWLYRGSILVNGRWLGLGSRSNPSSGNGLLAYRPDPTSTREVLLTYSGTTASFNTSSDIFVFSGDCPCTVADIADDQGNPLPGAPGVPNNGLTEGDYNAFMANFFNASPTTDIADDQGNPLPAAPGAPNNGVTEGDYNAFFRFFFDGCP